MKKCILKIALRKFKTLIGLHKSHDEVQNIKIHNDYKYLINKGVETELNFVFLGGTPIISKYQQSRIIIGKNVTLYSESVYNAAGINHPVILATYSKDAVIEIGNNCGLSGTSIVAQKKITIGENTMIGINVNIYDTDFHSLDPSLRLDNIFDANKHSKEIVIGKNVWIGGNSTILKGVTIGENSVIGANSLVNKDVPANVLYAGIPAKYIKDI